MKTKEYDPLKRSLESAIKMLKSTLDGHVFAHKTRGERFLDMTIESFPVCSSQGLFEGVTPEQVQTAMDYLEFARRYLAGKIGDGDVPDRCEWEGGDVPIGALIAAANFFEMPLVDLPGKKTEAA